METALKPTPKTLPPVPAAATGLRREPREPDDAVYAELRFVTRARALFASRIAVLLLGVTVLLIPSWSRALGLRSHFAAFVFLAMAAYTFVNYMVVSQGFFGRAITFATLCLDLFVVVYLIGETGGLRSPLLVTQLMYTVLFAILFPSPLAIVPPLLTLPVLARIDQLIKAPEPAILDLLILVWVFALNTVVVYVIVFLNQRDEAQTRELRGLEKELKDLAVVEERNRLAREIHDGLGASLSSLIIQAEYSQQLTGANDKLPELRAELSELKSQAEEAIDELRRSLRMMREDFDLIPALEEKCRTFGERAKLEVLFERSGLEVKVDPEMQLTIFRVLQESLNNIAKHAKAKTAKVGLAYGDGSLVLTIADDGVGFDQTRLAPGHYGLVHLRERARRLNGEATVRTGPGVGTVISLTLPTRPAPPPQGAAHG